jgi:hypothetical protein
MVQQWAVSVDAGSRNIGPQRVPAAKNVLCCCRTATGDWCAAAQIPFQDTAQGPDLQTSGQAVAGAHSEATRVYL